MTGPKFVITLSTSCTEVIIVCICSVFQNATLPSISITVNPSIMVAVLHAYLYNLYLIFFGLLARRIKALTIFSIMMKPNSSRWFLCGVPAPVYSKLMSIFQSFPFATYSNLKLYPALSHLTYLNCRPLCLHFLNFTQVGSIIPLFAWNKSDHFKPILSSIITPQWGLVTKTLIFLGLLKADISKKILTQLFLASTWSLDLITFLLLFDCCTPLAGF